MKRCVLALGFFDGVHIGHGGLLSRTRRVADAMGLPAAALTFDTHPDTLVFGTPVPLISAPSDREWLLKHEYGMDIVLTLHFDRVTMSQPWQSFITDTLFAGYQAAHVVCGHDFRFGDHGRGTPELLREFCTAHDVGCDIIPRIELEGQTVSSTLIRQLLEAGDLETAVRFLGHPHVIGGTVQGGLLPIPKGTVQLPTGRYRLSDGQTTELTPKGFQTDQVGTVRLSLTGR